MTNKMFSQYCSWLFDILFEFDKREKNAPPKTNGFLGERLFGIYYVITSYSIHYTKLYEFDIFSKRRNSAKYLPVCNKIKTSQNNNKRNTTNNYYFPFFKNNSAKKNNTDIACSERA